MDNPLGCRSGLSFVVSRSPAAASSHFMVTSWLRRPPDALAQELETKQLDKRVWRTSALSSSLKWKGWSLRRDLRILQITSIGLAWLDAGMVVLNNQFSSVWSKFNLNAMYQVVGWAVCCDDNYHGNMWANCNCHHNATQNCQWFPCKTLEMLQCLNINLNTVFLWSWDRRINGWTLEHSGDPNLPLAASGLQVFIYWPEAIQPAQ